MKNEQLPTQEEVITSANDGLTATENAETEPGYCWRYVRQRLAVAGFPADLIPPRGVDAKGAAQWYRKNHPELIARNGSVPGDVLFYEIGHGEHGHVGFRVPRNRLNENSLAHKAANPKDGRGTRRLDRVGTPTMVLRPFRK